MYSYKEQRKVVFCEIESRMDDIPLINSIPVPNDGPKPLEKQSRKTNEIEYLTHFSPEKEKPTGRRSGKLHANVFNLTKILMWRKHEDNYPNRPRNVWLYMYQPPPFHLNGFFRQPDFSSQNFWNWQSSELDRQLIFRRGWGVRFSWSLNYTYESNVRKGLNFVNLT